MLYIVADNHEHAQLAANEYQMSAWMYVSSSKQLRGIQDSVIVIAGPCKTISHELYYILRRMEETKRIITMRLAF